MIELGKVQTLTVQRVKEFGVYLGEGAASEASVLLPKKQVPEGAKPDCNDRDPEAFGRRDSDASGKGGRQNRSLSRHGTGEGSSSSVP